MIRTTYDEDEDEQVKRVLSRLDLSDRGFPFARRERIKSSGQENGMQSRINLSLT